MIRNCTNVLLQLSLGVALGMCCLIQPAQAQDEAYLRGYLDALLDTRFPDISLTVLSLQLARGEAVLRAQGCVDADKRRLIEQALIGSERVRAVLWDPHNDCDLDNAVVSAPPSRQEPATVDAVELQPLPQVDLFDPLIADPRQPQFALRYQYYKTPVDTFNAASVSFGDYFPFATGLFGSSGSSQIGLQGAVFALFNLDAPSSDLVNADYWIGVPVSYRHGRWSFLGRIYHQSSHLGDEFLLGEPGVNRINLSYEDLELLASYDWNRWRFYGGGGVILHSEPEIDRLHSQIGLEYLWPRALSKFDLIAAIDWQAEEERGWSLNRSYQLGLAFRKNQRQVRLMLEHFRGFSPNGQFYNDHLRYTGLGLYFDL